MFVPANLCIKQAKNSAVCVDWDRHARYCYGARRVVVAIVVVVVWPVDSSCTHRYPSRGCLLEGYAIVLARRNAIRVGLFVCTMWVAVAMRIYAMWAKSGRTATAMRSYACAVWLAWLVTSVHVHGASSMRLSANRVCVCLCGSFVSVARMYFLTFRASIRAMRLIALGARITRVVVVFLRAP